MNDRTIIRPGGRRKSGPVDDDRTQVDVPVRSRPRSNLADLAREHSSHKPSRLFQRQSPEKSISSSHSQKNNPLFTVLAPIILLASKVKVASSSLNLDELKDHIQEQIEYYRSINFTMDHNFPATEQVSYGLCCLLDDMVLNTPWGAKSKWASNSLLSIFHRDSWGGERFFEYLDNMSADPSRYLHTIEFYYAVLELGFEGKYRQMNDGMRALKTVMSNTYLLLENIRALEDMPLSDHWQSNAPTKNSLLKVIPQWVIWSLTATLLVVSYFSFSVLLSTQADPIKRALVEQRNAAPLLLPEHDRPRVSTAPVQQDLKDNNQSLYPMLVNALQREINQNLVVVEQRKDGVAVRLTHNQLFSSGSDRLADQYVAIVDKLGRSLRDIRVTITITGHSDNIPIRTIKYSDNWALSEARANTVRLILAQHLTRTSQIFARGLADTVNLVPNNTAQNRALNRRVEILVRN